MVQIIALDFAIVAAAVAACFKARMLPKTKTPITRVALCTICTSYIIGLQAVIQFLSNFDVLGEFIFGMPAPHKVSIWTLKISTVAFTSMVFILYISDKTRQPEQDATRQMHVLESLNSPAKSDNEAL